ncbi:MAG TPA: oxidoreductase [Propionibacteriaceae bacterium]|nr:oxidoreductase [Propionibacteriaceae bacterium]
MSTWFITGCSTGLGRHLAEAVLDAGHQVVVTARNVADVSDLVGRFPSTALGVALDVTDESQVSAAVEQAIGRFGQIDVLVNNAGYGYRSAVEEAPRDDIDQLFAANFFGPIALIKAVLPGMRGRRSGAIVNVSSIAVRITPAGSGYYAAVKGALEGLSGSLRKELEPLGISVITVEPGGFRTDFGGRSLKQSPVPIADYAETAGRRRKENDTFNASRGGDPAKAAQAMITAVESENPPAILVLGAPTVAMFRAELDARRAELDAWEEVSVRTSVED